MQPSSSYTCGIKLYASSPLNGLPTTADMIKTPNKKGFIHFRYGMKSIHDAGQKQQLHIQDPLDEQNPRLGKEFRDPGWPSLFFSLLPSSTRKTPKML